MSWLLIFMVIGLFKGELGTALMLGLLYTFIEASGEIT